MPWSWGGAAQGASRGIGDIMSMLEEGQRRSDRLDERNYTRGRQAEQDRTQATDRERSSRRQSFMDALNLEHQGYLPTPTHTDEIPPVDLGPGGMFTGASVPHRPDLGSFDPMAPGVMERVPGQSDAEKTSAQQAAGLEEQAKLWTAARGGDVTAQGRIMALHPSTTAFDQKPPVRGSQADLNDFTEKAKITAANRAPRAPVADRGPVPGTPAYFDMKDKEATIAEKHRAPSSASVMADVFASAPGGGRGAPPAAGSGGRSNGPTKTLEARTAELKAAGKSKEEARAILTAEGYRLDR